METHTKNLTPNAMKRKLKKLWLHLKAETPKFWNWVAGLSSGIPLLITAVNEATSIAIVPKWYTENLFYILGVAAIVTFYAKSRTTQVGKESVNQQMNP